jgi:predicted membrane protein
MLTIEIFLYQKIKKETNMSENRKSASWMFGIVLLVIGALLFLERSNFLFPHIYFPWWVFSWHTVLIVIGIILITTTTNRTAGLVLIVIGGLTLLPHWWPLLLVLLGLYLLNKGNLSNFSFSTTESKTGSDPDLFEVVTVFGGCNKFYQSQNFKGGTVFAAFGGSEINLYGCKMAEGINIIDVTAIFGGTSIQIPSEWNVQIDVTPIFGGASDKRIKSPNVVYDTNRVLLVKGATIFGGIEIKN